jgi:hypothetical protein
MCSNYGLISMYMEDAHHSLLNTILFLITGMKRHDAQLWKLFESKKLLNGLHKYWYFCRFKATNYTFRDYTIVEHFRVNYNPHWPCPKHPFNNLYSWWHKLHKNERSSLTVTHKTYFLSSSFYIYLLFLLPFCFTFCVKNCCLRSF